MHISHGFGDEYYAQSSGDSQRVNGDRESGAQTLSGNAEGFALGAGVATAADLAVAPVPDVR